MKKTTVLGFLIAIVAMNINYSIVFSQVQQKDKIFLNMIELLSLRDDFKEYQSRISISSDHKNKLIVSDLPVAPIVNSQVETSDYLLAPNAAILTSSPDFYLQPTRVVFSTDSCSMDFEVVNKYNQTIKGNFVFIPNKPSQKYNLANYTTRYKCTSKKVN